MVRGMKLRKDDILLMDLWSNSAFMGTDDMGLPCKAQKSQVDGRYHVSGQLQAAPKPVFQKITKDASEVIGAAGEATVMLLLPLPRYVMGRCCQDGDHVTNLESDDFDSEMQRAEDNATTSLGDIANAENVHVYSYKEHFGYGKELSEMATASGAPIWRSDDPVHLTEEAYGELALAILRACAENALPVQRARIESVVPGQRGAQKKRRLVRPMAWVAGKAENVVSRGGIGTARGPRGVRGGRPRGGRIFYGGRGRWPRFGNSNRGWYKPY